VLVHQLIGGKIAWNFSFFETKEKLFGLWRFAI
jgi:hypothetical protein